MTDTRPLERALRELHRVLLAQAVKEYVKHWHLPQPPGPGELLMLATRDEAFAWLRSLSELMADIDHVSELPPEQLDDTVPGAVRGAVETLLAPPGSDAAPDAFASRYWHYVHEQPEVAVAHAAVRQTLRSWPAPAEGGEHRAILGEHARKKKKE
jgi:hypothetical protein